MVSGCLVVPTRLDHLKKSSYKAQNRLERVLLLLSVDGSHLLILQTLLLSLERF